MKNKKFNSESAEVKEYISFIENPLIMRLWYFRRLPSVFFWGAKVKTVTPERSEVTVPYRWSTKNPFQSIYFATQAGVAELSTGILCNVAIRGFGLTGKVSMLVVDFQANYSKKANTQTTFVCEDGAKLVAALQEAIETGKGVPVTVVSIGQNTNGEEVSRFEVTWSFKVRSKR